jgi:hypothetical protein
MLPGALILLGAAALYLVPSMIAFGRERFGLVLALALNLFLGWTLLGCVAALFVAITSLRIDCRPKRECAECREMMLERGKLCPIAGAAPSWRCC